MRLVLVIISLISCANKSGQNIKTGGLQKRSEIFQVKESTKTYLLKRDLKYRDGKLLTRVRYFAEDGLTVLESTVSVSRLGTVNQKVALLPEASQFQVWFDKKKYFSQVKINQANRMAKVIIDDPDLGKKKKQEILLPKGRYFCFFSQIPECLKVQNLLVQAAQSKIKLYVIWDNFPFQKELYDNVEDELISLASLSVSDHNKKGFKFSLDIGNQILFYHYSNTLNFQKMFWVAQGFSMEKVKGN